jgi:hypothetical protein
MTMKRIEVYLVRAILVAGLAIGLSPGAQAQTILPCAGSSATSNTPCGSSSSSDSLSISDPFLVTFNENGDATISQNGGPTMTLLGSLITDPTQPVGGGAKVLAFTLPEPVITGTVSFTEPGGGISDWLRFTNAAGAVNGGSSGPGALMLFYSDTESGEAPFLADVGPPPVKAGDNTLACGVNPFCAGEIGPENGNNGFDYRPGGVPAPINNQYVGISDVPEPPYRALLACGLAGLGLLVRRRRLCRKG